MTGIAAAIGCSEPETSEAPAPMLELAECDRGGIRIQIYRFAERADAEAILELGASMTGRSVEDVVWYGQFLIVPGDPSVPEPIAAALGQR